MSEAAAVIIKSQKVFTEKGNFGIFYLHTETAASMDRSNEHAIENTSDIKCLEVLISKNLSSNLVWTLSVYSLQNQPVKKYWGVRDFQVFHFMVFDWKRTIQRLLEDNKVPYSIIQFFDPETIHFDAVSGEYASPYTEDAFLSAFHKLEGVSQHENAAILPDKSERLSDLLLETKGS